MDQHDDDYFVISSERDSLEYNKIPVSNNDIPPEMQDNTDKPKRPDYLPCRTKQMDPLSIGSTPVTAENTKIPLARTPLVRSIKKQSPLRPPPPKTKVIDPKLNSDKIKPDDLCRKDFNFYDDFVDISNSPTTKQANDSQNSDGQPVVLPNSPFYTPSGDLLGLDLFSDTVGSLSQESRSLITDSAVPVEKLNYRDMESALNGTNSNRYTNDISMNPFNSTDLPLNVAFIETENELSRSPVNHPIMKPTSEDDPFSGFFEAAKRDLQLKNKR